MTTETKVKPYREIVGGRLNLNFHEGQSRAWKSKARFPFMLGGTQVGKTCFAPDWLEREIRTCGPGDYLAVTATFPLLNLKLLPEMLFVFQDLYHYGEYNRSEKVFYFHKVRKKKEDAILFPDSTATTRIIFGSATNPESIESATAKAAVLDECGQKQFRRDAWEAVLRRLSLAQGRALGITTLYGYGWLKDEVYDEWVRGNTDFDIIQIDSIINPSFPLAEYKRARDSLPDWKFELFYRGRFAKPAGLIYDCFDSTNHVVEPFEIPKEWPVYMGHDFGTNNMAALWYAQDPTTGYFYLFQEYLEGGLSNHEHVYQWNEMSKGLRIIKRAGGSHQEAGWRDAFTRAGWRIDEPTVLPVLEGIQKVYSLNKTGRILVFRTCVNYLDQKQSYSWELDDKYNPTDKIESKERYHFMDAERAIMSDFNPVASTDNKPITKRSMRI